MQLLQICDINDHLFALTISHHGYNMRALWISPNGGTINQIECIFVQWKLIDIEINRRWLITVLGHSKYTLHILCFKIKLSESEKGKSSRLYLVEPLHKYCTLVIYRGGSIVTLPRDNT